ncbi:O-antigen ligase family protein [Actinocrispum sp. NPDC049592]|uniref:O-antigen ligase family protein n=1 Tax=Actinocrispum sp. NPDC049592 TaxID=3154835 RepID=UPI003426EEFE
MAERATEAAKVVIEAVQTAETPLGAGTSRVSGMISEAGRDPVNASREWGMLGLGLGLALGTIAGWLGCVLVRPRKWVEQIAGGAERAVSAAIFADEVDRELRGIFRGLKTKRGLVVVATFFVGIAGYAGTGSPYPVLLATLIAGAASIKDPRWIAVAVLVLGATVLEPKLDLVKIGPVTPTVLEVAVVIGLAVVWKRDGKSVLTWPIILATAAVLFGCARGLLLGGDFSEVADTARALLLVPFGFIIIHRAFAGRLPQLVAGVAIGGAAASLLELVATVAHWELLLVDERNSVITGTDTSEVARLGAPVLNLWGPLLILFVSGAFPFRPRWRLLLLALPGLLHEALSFNRSTWAPLLGFAVIVAVARFGMRGVVKRLIAAVVLGALALGAASGGVFGSTGVALADRVTSVLTGNALAEDSLADRQRENIAAMAALRDQPFFGTGVGISYGGQIISYDALHDRTVVEVRPWIHNQYIRMWLWFGVAGLIAIGLLMVRVIAVVWHSWRRRAPATVLIVALGLGLACLALQSILQTTLIDRPTLLVVALLLAMLGLATGWRSPEFAQVARTPLRTGRIMTR